MDTYFLILLLIGLSVIQILEKGTQEGNLSHLIHCIIVFSYLLFPSTFTFEYVLFHYIVECSYEYSKFHYFIVFCYAIFIIVFSYMLFRSMIVINYYNLIFLFY